MKKHLFTLLLTFVLCLSMLPAMAYAAGVSATRPSYSIMVNRQMCTVTVYSADADGAYTIPVKAMVCSVGREGHETPLGAFSLGAKYPWCYMVDGSYGQYTSRIQGPYLFHSICYTKQDPATMMTEEYNALGAPASLGCVRLQVADAKWIYDNCAQGTQVTIYDSPDPGPLGKAGKALTEITPEMANGWDPTDPRRENPWREWMTAEGEYLPFEDVCPGAWFYQDVRYAYDAGLMNGVGQRRFLPTEPVSRAMALQTLYNLAGKPMVTIPEEAMPWYTAALTWADSQGISTDVMQDTDSPDQPVTRQEFAIMLYRREVGGEMRSTAGEGVLDNFTDREEVSAFAEEAMAWAVRQGLLLGNGQEELRPACTLTRAELAAMLHRYCD